MSTLTSTKNLLYVQLQITDHKSMAKCVEHFEFDHSTFENCTAFRTELQKIIKMSRR